MPSHALAGAGLEATLEPSIERAPSSNISPGEVSSARRSDEALNRLLEQIAEALQANLTRGYLEGEERIRGIAEALHDVVALIDGTGD